MYSCVFLWFSTAFLLFNFALLWFPFEFPLMSLWLRFEVCQVLLMCYFPYGFLQLSSVFLWLLFYVSYALLWFSSCSPLPFRARLSYCRPLVFSLLTVGLPLAFTLDFLWLFFFFFTFCYAFECFYRFVLVSSWTSFQCHFGCHFGVSLGSF